MFLRMVAAANVTHAHLVVYLVLGAVRALKYEKINICEMTTKEKYGSWIIHKLLYEIAYVN